MIMNIKVYNGIELPKEILQSRLHNLRRKKNWYRLIRSLLITSLLIFLLFGVFFGIGFVRGQSMIPFFSDGDLVLIWRLSGEYHCNDVIFFGYNTKQCELLKRVVAVPGDTVDADESGRLKVNGNVMEDAFIRPGIEYPVTLLENEYFVLGDNKEVAMDSRNFGPVTKSDIDGKVILVFRTQIH